MDVVSTDELLRPQSLTYPDRFRRRLHAVALVRVLFGLLWASDASFKWLPGFIHGQTVTRDLNPVAVPTPVFHQWLELWHYVSAPDPAALAMVIAVTETLIALGMIFGIFSNLVFVGSAVYAFGLWTTPEPSTSRGCPATPIWDRLAPTCSFRSRCCAPRRAPPGAWMP